MTSMSLLGITTEASFNASNSSPAAVIFTPPPCRAILYTKIGMSSVKIWDVMILIPNVLFLFFLLAKIRRILRKLRMNNSPMFTVCLILVCLANIISVLRCVISMLLSSDLDDIVDRAMWLALKFFLLATELSVIVFGFMFGHLDSRRSVHRVIAVTFIISLAYSLTQGGLEFWSPNQKFHNITTNAGISYDLYGHGGMIFWFASSLFLSVLYVAVCVLPLTRLHNWHVIPVRKSFYFYCFLLAVLNSFQTVGCAMLHFANIPAGWCIVDVTAYLYFIGFAPLIYLTFLRNFFKPQPDDADGMLSHPSSFYDPPHDAVINAESDETNEPELRAAGGFPAFLNFCVGIPELKPNEANRVNRGSPGRGNLLPSRNSDPSAGLPQ